MDNPVTFSDITLLNTLATCANMTTDEVFKDFKIIANKKILKNMKFITRNQKKAGVLIYPMKPNLTKAVLLRGRVKRTLKKKSLDFISKSRKLKTVRMSHWKNYMLNGFCIKEIILP